MSSRIKRNRSWSKTSIEDLSDEFLLKCTVAYFKRKQLGKTFPRFQISKMVREPLMSYLLDIFEDANNHQLSNILCTSSTAVSRARELKRDKQAISQSQAKKVALNQLKKQSAFRFHTNDHSLNDYVIVDHSENQHILPNPLKSAHRNQILTPSGQMFFEAFALKEKSITLLHESFSKVLKDNPSLFNGNPKPFTVGTCRHLFNKLGLTTKVVDKRLPRQANPAIFFENLPLILKNPESLICIDEKTYDPKDFFSKKTIAPVGVQAVDDISPRFECVNVIAGLSGRYGILSYQLYSKGAAPVDEYMLNLLGIIQALEIPNPVVLLDVCKSHFSSKLSWTDSYINAGVQILILPTSCPHLNPIELFWGGTKSTISKNWTRAFLQTIQSLKSKNINKPTAKHLIPVFKNVIDSFFTSCVMCKIHATYVTHLYKLEDGKTTCIYSQTPVLERGGSDEQLEKYIFLKRLEE